MFAGIGFVVLSHAAMKPTSGTAWPGGITAFQLAFLSDAAVPCWAKVPFQLCTNVWPPGNCQRTVQPLIGALLSLVMIAFTWKRSVQAPVSTSCTEQVAAGRSSSGTRKTSGLMSALGRSVLRAMTWASVVWKSMP